MSIFRNTLPLMAVAWLGSSAVAEKVAETEGLLPVPDYAAPIANRSHLTGDWGGVRQSWADRGVTLGFDLTQFYQGVTDGGVATGDEFATNLDYRLNLDLMRMGVIPGALVTVRGQSRFGSTVNGTSGLLLPVNMYGAFPATSLPDQDLPLALTEVNWTQFLSEQFGFQLGKITTLGTSNEFMGGEGRTQFMNFQFNFPAAAALLAPYSTLAASAFWMPNPDWTVTTTLMNLQDASTSTGFSNLGEGTTWATTIDYRASLNRHPGGGSLGFYYAFNADLAAIGGLSLDPMSGEVSTATSRDGWALSWSGWQYLWAEESQGSVDPLNGVQDVEGIGLFLMAGLGDGQTNPVGWSIAGGFSGRGTIPTRDADTWGIGFFYNDLEQLELERIVPLAGSTQGLETYYSFKIGGAADLALNAQWTKSAFAGIDDAVLLGARLNLTF